MGNVILLLIVLFLFAVSFYLAFIRRGPSRVPPYARATWFVFLLLAVLVSYEIVVAHRTPLQLARFIEPYEPNTGVTHLPTPHVWMLTTSDQPDQVRKFYEDARHRKGWEITDEGQPTFTMRRGSTVLKIYIDRDSVETKVYYDLGR